MDKKFIKQLAEERMEELYEIRHEIAEEIRKCDELIHECLNDKYGTN